MRVGVELVGPGPAVVFAPGPDEGIGLGEDDAIVAPVDPLPFEEGLADVADMAEACVGARGEVGDEPGSVRFPQ